MAPPSLTVRFEKPEDGSTEPETVTFFWDFRQTAAPSLKSKVTVSIEWRPLDRPPIQQPGVRLIRSGPTQVSQAGEAPTPAGDAQDITVSAFTSVPRRFHQGVVAATINWTPKVDSDTEKGPQTFTKVESVGDPVNAEQTRVDAPVVPRLSKLLRDKLKPDEDARIKTSQPEPSGPPRFVFNGNLVLEALNFLHGRLRAGLGGFWSTFGPQCMDPTGLVALSEVDNDALASLTRDQLEEAWAQLVTEMLVGAAYHGPGSFMDADEAAKDGTNDGFHPVHRQDTNFFRLVRQEAKQGNLVFPMNVACQQLSTMILMSRSEDFFSLADDPLDCGSPKPNGRLDGKGAVIDSGRSSIVVTMDEASKKEWLKPGTSFFRDPKIRHVATLIRAFKNKTAQMMDTGGWNTSAPEVFNTTKDDKQPGIAYDTNLVKQLTDTTIEGKNPVLGVMIPPNVPDDKLIGAIKLLKRARSVGFTRLVIAKRDVNGVNPKTVLWVSRKLFMHEDSGGFHHYPVTRLLASLRGCPHVDRLDIRWQMFVPLGQRALENSFGNGLTSRWWEGPQRRDTDDDGKPVKGKAARTPSTFRPLSEWGTGTDGVPRVVQREMQGVARSTVFPSFLNELEALVDASSVRDKFPELADVPNDQLPAYFKK